MKLYQVKISFEILPVHSFIVMAETDAAAAIIVRKAIEKNPLIIANPQSSPSITIKHVYVVPIPSIEGIISEIKDNNFITTIS